MSNILSKMKIPNELADLLKKVKNIIVPESRDQLFELAIGGAANNYFEVFYNIPKIGKVIECTVAKCKNGLSINYSDPYMRKRDPNCLVVADNSPTDQPKFQDVFGKGFDETRLQTMQWFLEYGEIIMMPFMAGGSKLGYPSLLVAPANAAFFAALLADIQNFVTLDEIEYGFEPMSIMYIAPPFRLTHFKNKQVVVHNRTENIHEIFAYNLYPGPSAKKGVYSILLSLGEKDCWTTLHASTVKAITPHENVCTIMHEGESGSGKSEMLENIQRDAQGRVLLGTNLVTQEKVFVKLRENAKLIPVTDDMAMAPSQLQNGTKLVVTDAENGWFIRVDHVQKYGTNYELEKMTIVPKTPLIFLNIDAAPNSTALIWEHTMDSPDKPCSNPRVVIPRKNLGAKSNDIAEVDIRSFGLRTMPTYKDKPGYAVAGVFHILPPAIAWLWRLVAPRSAKNPSRTDTKTAMSSEGVGTYWPFATGKKVTQANILLGQIVTSPDTRYVLIPTQHIGCYRVDFNSEWVAREYLARSGKGILRRSELDAYGSPLFGFTMHKVILEGEEIPKQFLRVFEQPEVGMDVFLAGNKQIEDFFRSELKQYMTNELNPLGKKIIEMFIDDASLSELERLIPCSYIIPD